MNQFKKVLLITVSVVLISYVLFLPSITLASIESFFGFDTSSPQAWINSIYRYGLSLIAVLSLAGIIYGGFRYMTSSGNEEAVTSGKQAIIAALSGLVLALLSYLILKQLDPRLVELRLTVPEVTIEVEEDNINSRGLHCPEGASNTVNAGTETEGRRLCVNICGSEENIAVFQTATGSANSGSDSSVSTTNYCCGCRSGCPEGQTVIPSDVGSGDPQNAWCRDHCEGATHQVNGSSPACCDCPTESSAHEFVDAGNEISCLAAGSSVDPGTCGGYSGTNGTCRHNDGFGGGCEWTPTSCSSDSDCAGPGGETGAGHCWSGHCFQEQIPLGRPCENGDDEACASGHCEWSLGTNYCSEEECDGCLFDGSLCDDDRECRSGTCRTVPGRSEETCN